jgi:anti-sigma factor RsiW
MQHDKMREKVLLLRDGELPASEKYGVEAHLMECPSCRQLHEAVCRIGPMLFNEPEPPPSEDFLSSVMTRIDHVAAVEPTESGIDLPLRWWVPTFSFGLAAAALLAALPRQQSPLTVESLFSARMDISTMESQDYRITYLADLLAVPLEGR